MLRIFLFWVFLIFISAQTFKEAQSFIQNITQQLDQQIYELNVENWKYETNITQETEQRAIIASLKFQTFMKEKLNQSRIFMNTPMDFDTKRQFNLLKFSFPQLPLSNDQENQKIAQVLAEMDTIYSSGKYCENGKCEGLLEYEEILAKNRNETENKRAWENWRNIVIKMRPLYEEFVNLSNKASQEHGFNDTGIQWKSSYDMQPQEFETMISNLWNEVKPMYKQLHCYVKRKISKKYNLNLSKYIPAHLCGNMWCQEWDNIFDIVAPYQNVPSQDSTMGILSKNWTEIDMEKFTEKFFTGIGFPNFPESFWEKSMLSKPNRDVVCHASAWDFNRIVNSTVLKDVRMKMCTRKNEEDLLVQHHESGHIQYFLAYSNLPILYRNSANDGFHEAIGDTIALSITPKYLYDNGLIFNLSSSKESNINRLMHMALRKVSFLPFGYLIDQWRWKVFNGEISKDKYNKGWWDLRRNIQGIEPPVERTEDEFDPGAKYHIPANVPYIRYFLSTILQFQFHEALCKISGHQGPLFECSIADNKESGSRLWSMLQMGASKDWQTTLKVLTGSNQMNSSSMINYFKPLLDYLEKENQGDQCDYEIIESPIGSLKVPQLIVFLIFSMILITIFKTFIIVSCAYNYRETKKEKIEDDESSKSEESPEIELLEEEKYGQVNEENETINE